MPPFQGQSTLQAPPPFPQKVIIPINVGGTLFQTSAATLHRADPGSILCKTHKKYEETLFFDRDPEIFSLLLSILRTCKYFPSTNADFSLDEILMEASYYGVVGAVKAALSPPPFDALDAVKKSVVVPSGRDDVSSLSVDGDGNLLFSHGSKISVYDWTLRKRATVLTHFNCIDSLTAISPSIAVAGAVDFPGLHVYDLHRKTHAAAVHWVSSSPDLRLHAPTVQATAFCPSRKLIFSSFESSRKNAHTILLIDGESFRPVAELGREISSAVNSESPATKLEWINTHNLLLSSSVNSGPFGYRGVAKLWDIRSQKPVWQCQESNPAPGGKSDASYSDCFSDVAVGEDFGAIFKVGVRDGGLFMADLRNLQVANPWIFVGDSNPATGGCSGGAQNKVLGYGKQVFVSRGKDLEAWCDVGSMEGKVLRRSSVGGREEGDRITRMVAGGNRVFVARKGLQGVEVWESPRSN